MPTRAPVKVKIRYFAILRDERGASAEEYSTGAATLRELYNELASTHQFSMPVERLRVSVNSKFVDWSTVPHESDAIVFIPPVAGG